MKSERAVPRLIELARPLVWREGHEFNEHYSVKALVAIGEPAVPPLVKTLEETSAQPLLSREIIERETFALVLLRQLGPAAEEAIPGKGESGQVREFGIVGEA